MSATADGSTQENQYAQWQAAVAAALNKGKAPDRQLTGAQAEAKLTLTVDGLTIKPVYEDDAATRHGGRPGQMPFTRGSVPVGQPASTWQVTVLHDDPQVDAAAVANELKTGAQCVWFRVERDGLSPDQLAAALACVDLNTTPVVFSSVHHQRDVVAAVTNSLNPAATIYLGVDPFTVAQATGAPVDVTLAAEAITAAGDAPNVVACTLDASPAHLAGATGTDQVAITIAGGIDLLRRLANDGCSAADAWRHMSFRYAVDQDQFQNIALFRAARRLWARVGDVLDIAESDRGARTLAVTSERMMSTVDPYNNMLRTTIASFAAGLGGAQLVTTLPFDYPFGLPTEFSRRMARNTQALLLQESHLGAVIDPAGGSTYVEDLTDQIAEKAWALVQEIEQAGGYGEYLAAGHLTTLCADRAATRAQDLAHRTRPLTGVTEFAPLVDVEVTRTPRAERVPTGLPVVRDTAVAEQLRARGGQLATGAEPFTVPVLCLGEYKAYSARLSFVQNVLAIAGLAAEPVEVPADLSLPDVVATAPVVVLAAAAGEYAESGTAVLAAVQAAGATRVVAAGRDVEWGEAAKPTEYLNVRSNVVTFLTSVLDAASAATK